MGVRLSGMQSLALTKLDVLADLPEVSVCVAYKLDGKELDEPPTDPEDIARAEPVYAQFPGWDKLPSRRHATRRTCRRRRARTSRPSSGWPASRSAWSRVGPDRAETIRLHDPFA